MKYVILILVILSLTACLKPVDRERSEWRNAPKIYACTPDEMDIVHEQAKWCNENTSYYHSYCYGTAMMRNCDKKIDKTVDKSETVE